MAKAKRGRAKKKGTAVYVSKNGNDETGDGSAKNPYLSIQYAIDNAPRGSIINIGAGDFTEGFVIKKGIKLKRTNIETHQPIQVTSCDICDHVREKRTSLIDAVYGRYKTPPLYPVDYIAIDKDFADMIDDLRKSCGGSGNYVRFLRNLVDELIVGEIEKHHSVFVACLQKRDAIDYPENKWIKPFLGLENDKESEVTE